MDVSYHNSEELTLALQIWRPSPTVRSSGTGSYDLVGSNRFSAIYQTAGRVIVSPSPHTQIMFRPGDVIGFYLEEPIRNPREDRGVVVITSASFTSDSMWHASAAPAHSEGCGKLIGNNGDLNTLLHGAPVISIDSGNNSINLWIVIHIITVCCSDIQLSCNTCHSSALPEYYFSSYHKFPIHRCSTKCSTN